MLLIKRIFCSVHRNVPYYITWALILINTAFYICFLIVPAALCKPRAKIWTPEMPGTCLDVKSLYITSAVFNVFSDIAMLSVPIYLVWNLQMSIRRKIGISAIFCTGGLACIASVLRLVWGVLLTRTEDYTYVHFAAAMWAMAEIGFGQLCSNLCVLPRLYKHFCEMLPYANNVHGLNGLSDREQREREGKDGKSKREWMQLEERAGREMGMCADKARLEDEEALDAAVDEDRVLPK